MDKSREVWEQVPINQHKVPEKYRDFYRNLLVSGHIKIEDLDNEDPTVTINPDTSPELMDTVKSFCESQSDLLGQIAADIPHDDKRRFVVEMTHRLRIIALHEDSEFSTIVATLRDMVSKQSASILRNSAISYIAFYYFEHIQKAEQDNVVNMEEFRDRARTAVGQ